MARKLVLFVVEDIEGVANSVSEGSNTSGKNVGLSTVLCIRGLSAV